MRHSAEQYACPRSQDGQIANGRLQRRHVFWRSSVSTALEQRRSAPTGHTDPTVAQQRRRPRRVGARGRHEGPEDQSGSSPSVRPSLRRPRHRRLRRPRRWGRGRQRPDRAGLHAPTTEHQIKRPDVLTRRVQNYALLSDRRQTHRTSIELGSTSAIGAKREARRIRSLSEAARALWCHNGFGVFSKISGFAGLSGYRCRLPKLS